MFFHSLLPVLRDGPVPALNHFPIVCLTFIDPGKVCWVCTLLLIIILLYCKVTHCLFPPGCCPVRSQLLQSATEQFHFFAGTFISLFKNTLMLVVEEGWMFIEFPTQIFLSQSWLPKWQLSMTSPPFWIRDYWRAVFWIRYRHSEQCRLMVIE